MAGARRVVVVGASLAGFHAAETLREDGFDGTLTVVGAEKHLPYDRPPLSKQVLAGDWEPERAAIPGVERADDLGIDWVLGRRAVSFDAADLRIGLDDGKTLEADGVVIATGAGVRNLRGTEGVAGVHTLRTIDDCVALRSAFDATPQRVVVVGAGFIGAEVAATARGRGLAVTVLEALDVPLRRALGDEMGPACAAVHRDHGVDLRLGTGVDGIEGDGRVERLVLGDGTTIDAEVVVVGIGVVPNTEWLEGSGLTVGDGVVCDDACRAAPRVVAAGDVARWPNRRFGEVMRVEHWDNAIEQGRHAARTLLADLATRDGVGDAPAYEPIPYFWSDQYDRKIQLAGRSGADADVEVVHGSVDDRRFVALYGRAGRLVGALGMNRPRHVMQWRRHIEDGMAWDEALALAREDP